MTIALPGPRLRRRFAVTTPTAPDPGGVARLSLPDVLKTLAAQCIVLHHLSAYGPMSLAVQPHAGGAIEFVYDHGRAAVFVFLVLGGFLAAQALMPAPGRAAPAPATLRLVARRWLRLAWPYWFALLAAVASAALARRVFVHADTPLAPSLHVLLANALMIQDIVGAAALSAGVWYVAIDLQLYTVFASMVGAWRAVVPRLAPIAAARAPATIAVSVACLLTLVGWCVFGRDDALDMWAPYFFGAYVMGVLARWGRREAIDVAGGRACPSGTPAAAKQARIGWWALMASVCALALLADPRLRTVVAAVTACLLMSGWSTRWMRHRVFEVGARISYAVFLIHYPVSLLANALVYRVWGADPVASSAGIAGAWIASNVAGWCMFHAIETKTPRLVR
ncbi:MAG: acyltransferase family protein [Lautropia sp.]